MNAINPKTVLGWIIAGACSVGVHIVAYVVLLFIGSGSAKPVDHAVAKAPVINPAPTAANAGAPAAPGAETETPPTNLDTVPEVGRNPGRTSPAANANRGPTAHPAGAEAPRSTGETPIKTKSYTVKRGDSLIRLARKCGSTPAELAKLNGTDEKKLSALQPGQVIKLRDND